MTLEEAQERILELETEKTTLETEKEKLSQDNKKLTEDLERTRTYNQKLFDRLSQQDTSKDDKETKEDDVESCEEFAKKLTI